MRRSLVNLPSGNGRPVRLSLHELRDTYRTRAQKVGVDESAVEASMGHTLDSYGYNKVYTDLEWMWGELSKIYTANLVSKDELKSVTDELVRVKLEKDQNRLLLVALFNKIDSLNILPKGEVEAIDAKVSSMTKEEVDAYLKNPPVVTPPASTDSPPPSPPRRSRRR